MKHKCTVIKSSVDISVKSQLKSFGVKFFMGVSCYAFIHGTIWIKNLCNRCLQECQCRSAEDIKKNVQHIVDSPLSTQKASAEVEVLTFSNLLQILCCGCNIQQNYQGWPCTLCPPDFAELYPQLDQLWWSSISWLNTNSKLNLCQQFLLTTQQERLT